MEDNQKLFLHELNVSFQEKFEITNTENKYFSEAFSHYHKVMTEVNGQWLGNCLYLNENFFTLWNENTPQEMLNICLEHAVFSLTLNTPDSENINKEKG